MSDEKNSQQFSENMEENLEDKVEENKEVENNHDDLTDNNNEETNKSKSENKEDEPSKESEDKSQEYLERLQRTMAEFDNFRKRTIKEKAAMYENGAKEILEKIIPVIDNFERALSSVTEEEKESPFTKGIEMIYKQLMSTLKDIGVEEIEAIGNEFDPNLHHAVSHEENEEYGENEVIEVLQKGYMYKDKVLRYSMVKVVN